MTVLGSGTRLGQLPAACFVTLAHWTDAHEIERLAGDLSWEDRPLALCLRMLVYQYPKCGTCRKALKFLETADVEFKMKNIVESPPSKAAIRKAYKLSGLPINKLFNTSGQSYRNGGFKAKLTTMSDEEALSALAADGKLIKRPLVLGDGFALIGFREDEWREALGV